MRDIVMALLILKRTFRAGTVIQISLLLFMCHPATADIYRYEDEEGIIHFTRRTD